MSKGHLTQVLVPSVGRDRGTVWSLEPKGLGQDGRGGASARLPGRRLVCPSSEAASVPARAGGRGWGGVTREAEGACWSLAFSLLVWHVYPLARPSTAPLCSLHPKSEPAGSQASPTVRPHFRELRWRPPASRDPKAHRHLGSGTATGSERPPRRRGSPSARRPPCPQSPSASLPPLGSHT